MPLVQWEFLASQWSVATAVLAAVLLSLNVLPGRWFDSLEIKLSRWAAHPWICGILIAACSLIVNASIALHDGIPTPKIHDEFSYLLAGDTFAHGRLTNPTPLFFEHFETPQELTTPSRMSKYPPGQGIALMLGQIIAGEPIAGVWISTAAACVAIYWMLLGFCRPAWSLVGGSVASLSPAMLDWSQNYWGGSVAVLGGALLIGAWGRLMLRPSLIASFWLGVGLLILANSRPFEGLVFSVPLIVGLLLHTRRSFVTFASPAVLVLLLGGCWMAYDNFRVTGHVYRLPYFEYVSQYAVYPLFWFQPLRATPAFRNPSQQWVHTVLDRYSYNDLRHFSTLWPIVISRCVGIVLWNLKLAVLLPALVLSLRMSCDNRLRWIFISFAAILLAILAETVALPHYTAPATAAIFLLVISGWHILANWKPKGSATGRLLARAMGIGLAVGLAISACRGVSADAMIVDQQSLVNRTAQLQSGRHLVFVRYLPGYPMGNEFVYNAADIDRSPIIWVHWMGDAKDSPIRRNYPDRRAWLLTAGQTLDLQPYLPTRSINSN